MIANVLKVQQAQVVECVGIVKPDNKDIVYDCRCLRVVGGLVSLGNISEILSSYTAKKHTIQQ